MKWYNTFFDNLFFSVATKRFRSGSGSGFVTNWRQDPKKVIVTDPQHTAKNCTKAGLITLTWCALWNWFRARVTRTTAWQKLLVGLHAMLLFLLIFLLQKKKVVDDCSDVKEGFPFMSRYGIVPYRWGVCRPKQQASIREMTCSERDETVNSK